MNFHFSFKKKSLIGSAIALAFLSGCASVNLQENLAQTNNEASTFTAGQLTLATDQQSVDSRRKVSDKLLNSTLGQNEAVQLALTNSPALQALIAQNWAEAAAAAQSGRISNPIFNFERTHVGAEVEIGRLLSFGLLDLITLPQRVSIADQRIQQAKLSLTSDVVDHVTLVRQAWVRAVAAQQTLRYAKQVFESAQVSAELARRMEAVGNFNRITRARQQSFYADAATRLATAQLQETSTREELVRLLGLDDAQEKRLKLPERLPDIPKQPIQPEQVAKLASQGRLDIRLAQVAYNGSAKAQGLNAITSFTDIELGIRRDTKFDNAAGTKTSPRGYEVDVRLPIFDWGGNQRESMNARTLAAANRLESVTRAAGSHLRQSYAGYRTAYDLARHHRDEVIPLRKVISDENQLRYNAMMIGVFELLSDSRDQVATVMAAISAEQQFWLADAGLQASIVGKPTSVNIAAPSTGQSAAADPGH